MYSLEIQKEVLDKDNNNSFEKMTPGTFNLTKNKIVDVKLFFTHPPHLASSALRQILPPAPINGNLWEIYVFPLDIYLKMGQNDIDNYNLWSN